MTSNSGCRLNEDQLRSVCQTLSRLNALTDLEWVVSLGSQEMYGYVDDQKVTVQIKEGAEYYSIGTSWLPRDNEEVSDPVPVANEIIDELREDYPCLRSSSKN